MKTRHGIPIITGHITFGGKDLEFTDNAPFSDAIPEHIQSSFKINATRHYRSKTLFRLQEGRCFYCGQHMRHASHTRNDRGYMKCHLYPRAMGYALWGNKVLAHKGCGMAKITDAPTEMELAKFRRLYSEQHYAAVFGRDK